VIETTYEVKVARLATGLFTWQEPGNGRGVVVTTVGASGLIEIANSIELVRLRRFEGVAHDFTAEVSDWAEEMRAAPPRPGRGPRVCSLNGANKQMSYVVKYRYTGEGAGLCDSSLASRASLTEAILQMRSFESLLHTSGMRTRDVHIVDEQPGFDMALVVLTGEREIARVWIEHTNDAQAAADVESSPQVKGLRVASIAAGALRGAA